MNNTKNTTWRKVRLGDVAEELNRPYSPNPEEHLPYVGMEHIEKGSLALSSVGDSATVSSTKERFDVGDVLLGTLRIYFRKVVRPKFAGVCSTDITVLRAKEGYDQGFLFYLVANPYFINQASVSADGTKMPRAKWSYLASLEQSVPDLPTQTRIAEFLGAFDDKIELNNKIIKNLEELAQSIFRQWFVKFRFPGYEKVKFVDSELGKIPEGWEVGKVKNAIEIVSGYPFSSKLYSDTGVGVVTIKNVQNGAFVAACDSSIRKDDIPGNVSEDCWLDSGDILLSLTGNVGRVCFVYGGRYLLNQRVAKLKPTNGGNPIFTYYLFRQPAFQNRLINMAGGSAQPNLSPVEVGNIKLAVPPDDLLGKFNDRMGGVYAQLLALTEQNQKLAQMRDLFLPKVMKGEVKV